MEFSRNGRLPREDCLGALQSSGCQRDRRQNREPLIREERSCASARDRARLRHDAYLWAASRHVRSPQFGSNITSISPEDRERLTHCFDDHVQTSFTRR